MLSQLVTWIAFLHPQSSKPQRYVIVRTSESQTVLLGNHPFPELTENNISRASVLTARALEERLGLCRLLLEDAKHEDEH